MAQIDFLRSRRYPSPVNSRNRGPRMTSSVLCVCAGNTCRSPMLAAVIRREIGRAGGDPIAIESAGYLPESALGSNAAAEWKALITETGVDLEDHRSRNLRHIGDLQRFDLVICASSTATEAVSEMGVPAERIILANSKAGGIPDPYQNGAQAYRDCYITITNIANKLVARILMARVLQIDEFDPGSHLDR